MNGKGVIRIGRRLGAALALMCGTGVVQALPIGSPPLVHGPGGRLLLTPSLVELPDHTVPASVDRKGPILPSEVLRRPVIINVQPAGLAGGGRGPAPPRYDPAIASALRPGVTELRMRYILPGGIGPAFPGLLSGLLAANPQITASTETTYGPGAIDSCDSPAGCPSEPAEPDPPEVQSVYILARFDWVADEPEALNYILSLVNEGAMLILDGSDLAGPDGFRGTSDDNVLFEGIDPSLPFFRAFEVSGYDPSTRSFIDPVDITDRPRVPEPSTVLLIGLAAACVALRRHAALRPRRAAGCAVAAA
jgi:hypothetical protein